MAVGMRLQRRYPSPRRSADDAGQWVIWTLFLRMSRGPRAWLTSGALSIQLVAVGVGCALAAGLPSGQRYQILAFAIPMIFIATVHADVQQALLKFCRFQFGSRSITTSPRPLAVGSYSGMPQRLDNGPGEALFLRSFDRFEEILHEALTLQVGEIATQYSLPDEVRRLEETGFLTAVDRADWADCLSIRRSLLLADADRHGPSQGAVRAAMATMLRLQVRLTDRLRKLFQEEQSIRQQEDTALHQVAEKIDCCLG
jgi:hypothetical protein